jgi:hypothetical protein
MHPHRSHSTSTVWRSAFVAVALVTGVAACSSDSKSADTTAPPAARPATTTITEAPTTSAADTTTTVADTSTTVFDEANGAGHETSSTVAAETTTTLPKEPIYPLTGITNPDPNIASRPALVVKIDNASGARPQSGFNEADIVVEEIVNDNLTRFAMIFQSGNASAVGPIRSGRIQDIDLFTALDRPLFAWSGGNRTVTDAINASELLNIGSLTKAGGSAYYRTHDKGAPHNLYSSTDALFGKRGIYEPPAKQQFNYRPEGTAPAGTPSPGVAVALDSIDARWDWNASTGLYERRMEGKVHNDALTGDQITTNNVLVLVMDYAPGISHSPDAQTIGTGEAFVLTGGNYIHGTWSRGDKHDPFALHADDGSEILLTPGRTFIELPRDQHTLVIPA